VPDALSSTASGPEGEWPLVGRDAERAQIVAAHADAYCIGVIISGAPGIGRSRLAREVVFEAGRRGDLIYWTQATASSATIPLGAFAALIPDDVRSEDPLELIRRSTERVHARAAGRDVWLGVDDAQMLDPASAALVLNLATAAGVFVVVTVAAGHAVPDAIDSLWKDRGARRIELRPLDETAIEQLVQTSLGGPVEQSALHRVVDASRGSVLYARELVIGALQEGRLVFDNGLWRLRRRDVSPSLSALVTARMGALEDAERYPLELLALGEPLRLSEMAVLADLGVLEELEARRMVSVAPGAPDSVVRLSQPLYGEVLRAGLPTLRARSLRLRLAEIVAQRSPLMPDDALRISRWRLDAGLEVPAEYLLEAGRAANAAADPELGERLGGLALDAGLGLAAVLVLGRAQIIRNRFEEAEAVLAAAEGQAAGQPQAVAYIAQRVHVLYWGLRRVDEARALLERAAGWSLDPEWTRKLDPWRFVVSGFVDGIDPRTASAEPERASLALENLNRETPEARQSGLAEVFRLMAVGRIKDAEALVQRIQPRLPLVSNDDAYALGLTLIIGLEGGEDWTSLAAYAERLVRDGVQARDHQAAGLGAFSLAALQMARGHYRDARRWLAEADGHFALRDAFGTVFSLRALDVGVAFFTGDLAGARAGLATVRAMVGESGPTPTQTGYLSRAEGWGARALSDAAGAESFMAAAATTDQPNLASRLLYEALRSGGNPKVIAKAQAELAERCDARLVAAYAAHATARSARDGQALLRASDELAAIGADAYAMEAAAEAARQFLIDGREDSARRAASRARELFATDQDGEPPTIDGLDSVATELTRREAQIAALAAHGLSNQEIADQLVLSVRSVETYVYRAMQKRGAASRQEL
jgi:DNA-binding CsgD family transcriptional regulator